MKFIFFSDESEKKKNKMNFVLSLLIIIGLMILVVIFPNAYALCAAPLFGDPGPCFDSFMGSTEPMTQKYLMENFHKHMEYRHDELQIHDRDWNSYKTPIPLPAILCTEFVVDGMKQYRMAQWVDTSTISSWENHYNPLLCTKWLAPIDDGIKIKWDKLSYLPDDVFGTVKIIDKDMNLGNSKIDFFKIHVWSDIDHKGIQLTMTETNLDTGIFTGKVFFSTTQETKGARLLIEDAVKAEHKGNRDSSRIIYEPEPSHTTEELDEMCKNGQAICDYPSKYGRPFETSIGKSSDGMILPFLVIGISAAFIFGMIYWWKRK